MRRVLVHAGGSSRTLLCAQQGGKSDERRCGDEAIHKLKQAFTPPPPQHTDTNNGVSRTRRLRLVVGGRRGAAKSGGTKARGKKKQSPPPCPPMPLTPCLPFPNQFLSPINSATTASASQEEELAALGQRPLCVHRRPCVHEWWRRRANQTTSPRNLFHPPIPPRAFLLLHPTALAQTPCGGRIRRWREQAHGQNDSSGERKGGE